MDALAEPYVRVDSYLDGDALDSIADDVREGLTRDLKELPPKYFYDARGSELFDRITEQPEYYPTRAERSILNRRSAEIAMLSDAEEIVELGSGSASKTRALLYALASAGSLRRYVPVDVSEPVVERCAQELATEFPGLSIHGVVGDFEHHLEHVPEGSQRLFAFLGGTIGNLYPSDRARFLDDLIDLLGSDGRFLLGVDLVKDVAILEAAYNDRAGITAEFNRNVLQVVNQELGADFDPGRFRHVAFFDPARSWIEMRLRARGEQRVSVPGAGIAVEFSEGEEMRTEISAKFTPDSIEAELVEAGFELDALFTDEDELFALVLARPR